MAHKSDVSVFFILIKRSITIALIWTVLCFVASYWNVVTEQRKTLEFARREARAAIDKDQALRLWAAEHNGVYVPVTKENPPNEFLSDLPERDITTPSGRQLTMVSPAQIFRQVMNSQGELTRTHITSLKVVNHLNRPDEWEKEALHRLDAGTEEVVAVSWVDGQEYLRLIKPLHVRTGCLDCHAQQGYKEGDVRGGVSVTLPLADYRSIEKKSMQAIYLTHTLLWLFGLLAIVLIFTRSKKRRMERLDDLLTLEEQSEKIKIFAYSVAHDLKNPVISIHGLASLLKKKQFDQLDEKGRQYCEQIIRASGQLSTLVDQINIFISAKEQPLSIEPIDFPEICQTLKEEYEAQLHARNVRWVQPARVEGMRADRMAIIRIMRNLVDNALKYSGERLSRLTIACREESDHYQVSVTNDGNPISPDACRNIFIRFKRNCVDQKVRGTGLGLAIVKELVGLHGGDVWVESDGIDGVTFYFTIAKTMPTGTRSRPPGPPFRGRLPKESA